jgi:hypothetical protein
MQAIFCCTFTRWNHPIKFSTAYRPILADLHSTLSSFHLRLQYCLPDRQIYPAYECYGKYHDNIVTRRELDKFSKRLEAYK